MAEKKSPRADKPAPPIDRPANQKNDAPAPAKTSSSPETGGRDGPDPTRYGDWEKNGRCIDF